MEEKENIQNRGESSRCLIHLDRLIITLRLTHNARFKDNRNPDDILALQKFGNITLQHDFSPGSGAYYHSYKVYHKGIIAGMLHSSNKLKINEVQFHFDKELFYSYHQNFWYEVYESLLQSLGLEYNNINYLEIAVDTDKDVFTKFKHFFTHLAENKLGISDRYSTKKGTMIHTMNNGSSFIVDGSYNTIAIYTKSDFAEEFIREYFKLNNLDKVPVYRIECRLKWNYIRYLRNKKQLNIDVETLLDSGQLAYLFKVSTRNKLTFKDRFTKSFDNKRNKTYAKVSVLDYLEIDSAEIGILKSTFNSSHYSSNNNIDENILRQNYFRFLETGKMDYLKNMIAAGKAANYGKEQIEKLFVKFNRNYKGHWTPKNIRRLNTAQQYISKNSSSYLSSIIGKVECFFLTCPF